MIFLVFFNARPLSSTVSISYTKGIRHARTEYSLQFFNECRQIEKAEGFVKHVMLLILSHRMGISQFIS